MSGARGRNRTTDTRIFNLRPLVRRASLDYRKPRHINRLRLAILVPISSATL